MALRPVRPRHEPRALKHVINPGILLGLDEVDRLTNPPLHHCAEAKVVRVLVIGSVTLHDFTRPALNGELGGYRAGGPV